MIMRVQSLLHGTSCPNLFIFMTYLDYVDLM